jgi:hypothetical protein
MNDEFVKIIKSNSDNDKKYLNSMNKKKKLEEGVNLEKVNTEEDEIQYFTE